MPVPIHQLPVNRGVVATSLQILTIIAACSHSAFAQLPKGKDQDNAELADVRILAAVRPWIAEAVGMTQEQRSIARAAVIEFQEKLHDIRIKFMLDRLNTTVADTISKAKQAREEAIGLVREHLTEPQRRQVIEMASQDNVPSLNVFQSPEPYSASSLFQMQPLESVELTSGQKARLRAMLMQAEEDFQEETVNPDRLFKLLRQKLHEAHYEMTGVRHIKSQRAQASGDESRTDRLQIYLNRWDSDPFDAKAKQAAANNRMRSVSGLRSMTYGVPAKDAVQSEIVLWHSEDEIIQWVTYSPDEGWIVTIGATLDGMKDSSELRLWNAKTGKLMDNCFLGAAVKGDKSPLDLRLAGSSILNYTPFRSMVRFITSEHLVVEAETPKANPGISK